MIKDKAQKRLAAKFCGAQGVVPFLEVAVRSLAGLEDRRRGPREGRDADACSALSAELLRVRYRLTTRRASRLLSDADLTSELALDPGKSLRHFVGVRPSVARLLGERFGDHGREILGDVSFRRDLPRIGGRNG